MEETYESHKSKENRRKFKILRKIKHILSSFYVTMMELELVGMPPPESLSFVPSAQDLGIKGVSEVLVRKQNEWEAVWHSNRRKLIGIELDEMEEGHREDIKSEMRRRSRDLYNKRREFLGCYKKATDMQKEVKKQEAKKSVCRICQKKNLPTKQLMDHNRICKKIEDIKKELLQVNQWLITECANTAPLKKLLEDTFKIGTQTGMKKTKGMESPSPMYRSILKSEKKFDIMKSGVGDKKVSVLIPEERKIDDIGDMKPKRSTPQIEMEETPKDRHASQNDKEELNTRVSNSPSLVLSNDNNTREATSSLSNNGEREPTVKEKAVHTNSNPYKSESDTEDEEVTKYKAELPLSKPSRFSMKYNKQKTMEDKTDGERGGDKIDVSSPDKKDVRVVELVTEECVSMEGDNNLIKDISVKDSVSMSSVEKNKEDHVGAFFDSERSSSSDSSDKSPQSMKQLQTIKKSRFDTASNNKVNKENRRKEKEVQIEKKKRASLEKEKEVEEREKRELEAKERVKREVEEREKKEKEELMHKDIEASSEGL